jgi:RNA polymerase sigma-70 factor (ECF subfamily)
MDDLVQGLKAGEPAAFERLVRVYGDKVYRFARRLAGERWADDVAQETFIRVFRSIRSYRPTGRFESWLFTIANRLAIDALRRQRPEASMTEIGLEDFAGAPAGAAEDAELRLAILREVERLPVEQKQVFLLREEAGLSFREIAELTGCPLNTALGRMHYAMEHLRKALKTHGMQ